DSYNVRSYGATGDGKTDDTAAFQHALDQAAHAGGGTVHAPRGNYLFAGHLNVPNGVTLEGIWQSVPAHNGIRDRGLPRPTDDVGRIENVHFNPWWSNRPGLFQWQMEHGEAFVFGRTDWQYVLNTFCFGYNVGYRFAPTAAGSCNGNFLGIGADDCYTAVVVD